MCNTYSMNLAGKNLSIEIGKVAEMANAAVIVRYGDTTVLVTATSSEKPRDGIDFFPLSIDYEERLYAVGKIPGGFIKREGRPTEKAILTSRLIDRPIRPLFPKDYRNDVAIIATVMSVDQDYSPEIAAMIGSSVALCISDIPFNGPVGSVNIGLIDEKLIINPTLEQREKSSLSLVVSSTIEKVMMIEAGADEVKEDKMLEAIILAHEENKKIVEFINKIVKEVGKTKHTYEERSVPEYLYKKIIEIIGKERMQNVVFTDEKQKRQDNLNILKEEVIEKIFELEYEKNLKEDKQKEEEYLRYIEQAINKYEKVTVRNMILKDHKRPDGRKIDEIRKLSAEIDIIPRVHGSALFNRGQTQILTITTLGSMTEVQHLDGLDEEEIKRYMHHYNFPSYSVGETKPSRGPGRREIGHGALAERALYPVIPTEEEFPYAIRLVSEVLSSNGSTSQGSVCASSLSLMAAGVPIKSHVAGISVGLITSEEDDEFVLLTDIQGIEDFFGDMDFKVAGTKKGITAIQMDIKINGLTIDIIKQSLENTRKSRYFILDEIMEKCIKKPREEISKFAPKIAMILIDPEKMSDVIGIRGKTIKKIIEETGVDKIDTENDGKIFISHSNIENINKAKEMIENIVMVPEIGEIYTAKVIRIVSFGAFVEFCNKKEGLVHISKISHKRIEKVEDELKINDIVNVKVINIDEKGRINLSIKDTIEKEDIEDIKKEDIEDIKKEDIEDIKE